MTRGARSASSSHDAGGSGHCSPSSASNGTIAWRVLSFNSIPLIELYCGIPAAGRVQVPLNFRWADPELAYAIEDAGRDVLFIDRDPGSLADLVDTVIRLDTGEYDARLEAAAEADFDDDVASGRSGRAVLHRWHHRGVEGRDAHPRAT